MIKKTASNQSCGRDSEYMTGAFLKSFSIHKFARFHVSTLGIRNAYLNIHHVDGKFFD